METSPKICSPARKQTQRSIAVPAVDKEMQQVEVTLDGTQAQTQGPRWSMWIDFTDAVRDLLGLVGCDGEERWVRSKRGCVSCTDHVEGAQSQPKVMELPSHNNLNLNLSLKKAHRGDNMRGRGGGQGRTSGFGTRVWMCEATFAGTITILIISKCLNNQPSHSITVGFGYCACGCVTLFICTCTIEVDVHDIQWS